MADQVERRCHNCNLFQTLGEPFYTAADIEQMKKNAILGLNGMVAGIPYAHNIIDGIAADQVGLQTCINPPKSASERTVCPRHQLFAPKGIAVSA